MLKETKANFQLPFIHSTNIRWAYAIVQVVLGKPGVVDAYQNSVRDTHSATTTCTLQVIKLFLLLLHFSKNNFSKF